MHVRTRLPSNITSQDEQLPCLQLNERRNPDRTHARLSGCPDCMTIVFPLSKLETETYRRMNFKDLMSNTAI